jgi:hypothetical protein
MAFKQYTRCISPADFSSRVRYITIATLLAGAPAAAIAVAANHPACLPIVLDIMALAALVAYYHNWLYHRLICLEGDKDCLGAIVSIGGPVDFGLNIFDRDTDYSINLLLENCVYSDPTDDRTERKALHVAAEQTMDYGELIKPHQSVLDIGVDVEGHFGTDRQTKKIAPVLHAEFEGDGNYKMLQASKVLLAFAIFSLAACILGGPAGWIVALGITLFSLLVLLITSLLGETGEGSPSDVNAGELTDNTGVDENGVGVGADIVYVQGSWVCDSLHERWNEIHPIKICMKMGTWDGSWPTPETILRIRNGFDVARAPETIANQELPENRWQVHPDLDGCSRDIIL